MASKDLHYRAGLIKLSCLTSIKNPKVRLLVKQTPEGLQKLFQEIPLWIKKNPYYDRLDWLNKFMEYMWLYLNKANAVNLSSLIIFPPVKDEFLQLEGKNSLVRGAYSRDSDSSWGEPGKGDHSGEIHMDTEETQTEEQFNFESQNRITEGKEKEKHVHRFGKDLLDKGIELLENQTAVCL
ncbi:synaptotagmin A [Striga asiatica]|uniref:Synaptotagmin A n=1 Tax=Striga asiatica TaxID=4170 RepID=A0A5A7Q3W8_STRAF|nr:synaptotagmin A [Striga asiatica]